MKKSLLTGLTIAGIAGSAGAAYAGVSVIENVSAESTPSTEATQPQQHELRTITYQIGAAGTVTLTSDGTTLTVADSTAGTGWSIVGATAPGAHVEVQLTDGVQLVTFGADQVGEDIVVSLTNVEAPGATTTTVAAPAIEVTVIADSHPETPHTTHPAPAPAPKPTVAPTTTHAAPPPAATTAPSSGGDDDEHEDEHEDEGEDD